MIKKLKTLVINRNKWARASAPKDMGESALLNENGNQCCLGFLAEACGFSRRSLLNESSPGDIFLGEIGYWSNLAGSWPEGVLSKNLLCTPWTSRAMLINDIVRDDTSGSSSDNSDKETQKLLIKHFRKIGYKLVFVDE